MSGAHWPVRWTARWIWGTAPTGDIGSLFGATSAPTSAWNRFFHLRRDLHLDAVPGEVPCRVTADSRFVLYVNGTEVSRGPSRSIPERLAWTEVDLAPHLLEGANCIAALVRFYGRPMAWWRPARPSFQLGYGSFVLEAPAVGLVSDETWRALPGSYEAQVPGDAFYPVAEVVDGRGVPVDWTLPGYDDHGWAAAAQLSGELLSSERDRVPATPFTAMVYDEIAPLTAIPLKLRSIGTHRVPAPADTDAIAAYTADSDALLSATVWDAGAITLATPWAEVRAPEGTVVDLYVGEDVGDAGQVVITPRNWTLRYTARGGGSLERIESFEAVGFRYLTVVIRGEGGVSEVGAVERRYPREPDAFFACSDDQLTRVWELGARTLDVCSSDAFLDCPGREQRAWVGDAYIHTMVTFAANPDWRLARRNLRICADSQRPDGLLSMSATGDLSIAQMTIPDYSLHWIRSLARYYEHTGDLAIVHELLPVALRIADTFERWRDADGLLHGVPGWVFIDWAQTERAEVIGALDAIFAAALDDLAGLVEATGAMTQADELRARAERTRTGFEQLWDDERGVYVDALNSEGTRLRRVSQQTNAAAIVARCGHPERWARSLDYVLDESRLHITVTPAELEGVLTLLGQWLPIDGFDEDKDVVMAQPFFSHFLHQAVALAGRRADIAELCRRWWPQVERGNTTVEEFWDAARGTASRAHAWAATPTYDLCAHVLGVRPASPGYAEATIAPILGTMTALSGSVPTPHGPIAVSVTADVTVVEIPFGITAEVTLPGESICRKVGAGHHELRRA